jgi:hypothetical protein
LFYYLIKAFVVAFQLIIAREKTLQEARIYGKLPVADDYQFAKADLDRGTVSISCSYSTSTLGPARKNVNSAWTRNSLKKIPTFRFLVWPVLRSFGSWPLGFPFAQQLRRSSILLIFGTVLLV